MRTGQVKELMEALAPDVVLIVDGGGLDLAASTSGRRFLTHRLEQL